MKNDTFVRFCPLGIARDSSQQHCDWVNRLDLRKFIWLGVVGASGFFTTIPGRAALPTPPVSPAPVVTLEYDAQGNPTKTSLAPTIPGFNFTTSSSYDRLSRRKDSTDARSKTSLFEYSGRADLTKVVDPRNLITQYPRNGLGDPTSLISPDTGTAAFTYDAAGNVKTRLDSRGVLATYGYDAVGRVTTIAYSESSQPSVSQVYQYDQQGVGFSNGAGRLTSTSYPGGSAQYSYDAQGRLLSSTQMSDPIDMVSTTMLTHATKYTYDSGGRPLIITYPSGREVRISYVGGLPADMSVAANNSAQPQPILSGVQYEPFGQVSRWLWQMGAGTQLYERVFDASGRMVRYRMGNTIRDLSYDAADRITSYTHYDATTTAATPTLNQGFGYDQLGRLTGITYNGSAWSIGYDDNGNRTSVSVNGNATAYATSSTSNRLVSLSNPARNLNYDLAGNTTTDSQGLTSWTATYNLINQLDAISRSATSNTAINTVSAAYRYNAFNQRVSKSFFATCQSLPKKFGCPQGYTSLNGVLFVYDQQGQLLGEYNASNGAVQVEYVWLDNIPVAMMLPDPVNSTNPPVVYYIQADHLNTPRVVVNTANQTRWQWLAEPFGTTAPLTNPAGLGEFTLNLRFAGQYFDNESGLSYNYFRTYDPSNGRYTQSDPIGLAGGINTYAYVENRPTMLTDPEGLLGRGGSPSRGGYWGKGGPPRQKKQCACSANASPRPGVGVAGQVGGQASVHALLFGMSYGAGVAAGGGDVNAGACVFRQVCMRVGPGVFVGGGVNVGAGVFTGPISGSGGLAVGGGFDIGAGAGAGGQITVGVDQSGMNSIGGSAGTHWGAGYGFSIGADFCWMTLDCSETCPE